MGSGGSGGKGRVTTVTQFTQFIKQKPISRCFRHLPQLTDHVFYLRAVFDGITTEDIIWLGILRIFLILPKSKVHSQCWTKGIYAHWQCEDPKSKDEFKALNSMLLARASHS